MIRYIRLNNFRRHADSEISLDSNGQIVLIAGQNGAGKSTIVESIIYGLYGEGRHGTRYLDRMIRRGAELEGMEVEIEFDVADTVYRVKRRRDNKLSSAVLYGNDVALMEGAREVTREITRLLGMDSRGFRLAVVAQQKELDGLASMRAGERGATLSRLLRFDAVSSAKERARGMFRSERDALRGLGSAEDPEIRASEIKDIKGRLEGLVIQRDLAAQEVSGIDERISALFGTEQAYSVALSQQGRLDGLVESATSEYSRITEELARIVVGPEPGELADPRLIAEELSKVEASLAVAESNRRLGEQASMVGAELQKVVEREIRLQERVRQIGESHEELEEAEKALDERRNKVNETMAGLEVASDKLSRAHSELQAAQNRAQELAGLEARCELCGQDISDEHKTSQQQAAKKKVSKIRKSCDALEKTVRSIRSMLDEAREQALDAESRVGKTRARLVEKEGLTGELVELSRRRETYEDQLARIEVVLVDDSVLLEQRARLSIALGEAQSRAEAEALRQLVLERYRVLKESEESALARLEEARTLRDLGQVSPTLVAAHLEFLHLEEAKAAELALMGEISTQVAVLAETLRGLESDYERVVKTRQRRAEMEKSAQVAAECARVLDEVGVKLNQQIRPALEGLVGELLSRLSDGRFDAVSLDQDYNLSVREAGAMRALGDFSGGEIDLIALAMRLALAGVVSERHGAGGAGFLILDECFGSQDQQRRESILSALRGLRGVYGQILLISHVGGLEDSADLIIEVSIDKESGVACATTM